MFQYLAQRLFGKTSRPQENHAPAANPLAVQNPLSLTSLTKDPYLYVSDESLNLISVFDDLKYDRADMDILSGPMRSRVLAKLTPLGFRQVQGNLIEHGSLDIQMHIPKFRALGASPFDAVRDSPRREQDYYILTPTQTACQMIDSLPTEAAVEAISILVKKQPVNLLRIFDYLDKTGAHEAFRPAIGHLKIIQREAVQSEPLCRRRALR